MPQTFYGSIYTFLFLFRIQVNVLCPICFTLVPIKPLVALVCIYESM